MSGVFSADPPSRPRQDGSAFVIVLLLTLLVTCMVVGTAGIGALGARGGTGSERHAYQALLAAESTLDAFTHRYAHAAATHGAPRPSGSGDAWQRELNDWLSRTNLAQQQSVTLRAVDVRVTGNGAAVVTLAATAHPGGSRVRRTVLQDFLLRPAALAPERAVRAAITSVPPVDAQGGVTATGTPASVPVTTTTEEIAVSAGTRVVTVRVRDVSALAPGDALLIDGDAYTVDAVGERAVTLRVTQPGHARFAPAGRSVTLVLSGPAASAASAGRIHGSHDALARLTTDGQPDCHAQGAEWSCRGAHDAALTRDTLSVTLLGLTDPEIDAAFPLEHLGTLPRGGTHRVTAAHAAALLRRGGRGAGTLIIDGDATLEGDVTFDGLIYVRGAATIGGSGHLTVNGSVAVQGSAFPQDTRLAGNASVRYDPLALRAALAGAGLPLMPQPLHGTRRLQ